MAKFHYAPAYLRIDSYALALNVLKLFNAVMRLKDAYGMAKSVDPDQITPFDLNLHYLLIPVGYDISDLHGNIYIGFYTSGHFI